MEAVIIDCLRTAIGKAPKGTLRNTRPDDLAATVLSALLEKYPQVPRDHIDDVILASAPRGCKPSRWRPTAFAPGGRTSSWPGAWSR